MVAFECERYDILQFKDSDVKKVVVFVLYHHCKFNWHCVGKAYQMTWLYVQTVAEELLYRYRNDGVFREKIDFVINSVKPIKMAV